jgi:hypothetical protein
MDFLITEEQLKIILMEQDKSKMTTYMKQLNSFTSNMVNRAMKTYGINLKMLLTWGTSVGGLMMPLDNYIRSGNFNLTDDQRALVLSGIAFILFFEGRTGIKTIMKKIKDEGIQEEFDVVLSKTKQLKIAFEEFLWSLKFSMGTALDTVAYSFLIPIITDIYQASTEVTNVTEAAALITERLLASGFVVVGKEVLSTLIKKLIKKFKG